MEKLVINKKENIACWRVDTTGVCPNTVVELDDGITIILEADGEKAVCHKSGVTVFSLLNAGKKSKLFGGKKPYDDCKIYAVNTSSDFKSEWGLAGGNALRTYDPEFGVEANAIARGTYHYCVRDFFAFIACFSFDNATEITRENVREFFRAKTESVVSPFLSSKVAAGIDAARPRMAEYADEIKFRLNRHLASCGVEVVSYAIDVIEYEPSHKMHRDALKKAKIEVAIKGVENEGRRDDISVEKEQSEIEIGYIKARGGNYEDNKSDTDAPGDKIICPRCGEANDGKLNYCGRCGEKLRK